MALTPVHRNDQLDPRAIRFQSQVQAHRADPELIPHHQLGNQGTRLEQLNRSDGLDPQRMLSIIRSDVPGIPELPPIPVPRWAQRCRELSQSAGIP